MFDFSVMPTCQTELKQIFTNKGMWQKGIGHIEATDSNMVHGEKIVYQFS